MSVNYYLKTGKKKKIYNNGVESLIEEKIHIGKFNFGWKFCLHIIPEMNLNELKDWKPLLKSGKIFDEYGVKISYDEIMNYIKSPPFPFINTIQDEYCKVDTLDNKAYCLKNKIGIDGNSYVLVEGEFR